MKNLVKMVVGETKADEKEVMGDERRFDYRLVTE